MITIGRKNRTFLPILIIFTKTSLLEFVKTWLLFVFVCSAAFTALGVEPQPRVKGDAIYLYCSASTQDTREGIERFEDAENDNDPLFAHRPISFEMKSKQKKHLHTLFPLQFQSGGTQQNPPGRPRKRSDGNRHGNPQPCCGLSIRSIRSRWKTNWHPSKRKKNHGRGQTSLKATGKQIYLIDWNDPINGSGGTELRLIQVAPTTINRPLF